MLALDQALEFDSERDAEFFQMLPPLAAVYRIEPRAEGARPYLRRTANLRRSCRRLLSLPDELISSASAPPGDSPGQERRPGPRPQLNLRDIAARVRYRLTASRFEQSLAVYQQARELFPGNFRQRLRLAPPALLKINLAKEYPRCYVTRRVSGDGAFYFGPFPSRRAADDFAQEFLALFKIRRCHIPIRRDPDFPGCIYSEMKMCLAPCYAGCTKPEYDAEVARVAAFLASRGVSLVSQLETERDRAAAGEDFELAATIHKKREKVAAVLKRLPELIRGLGSLDAAILQPAAGSSTVSVFGVRGGKIGDPLLLNFAELSSMPRSVETILRDYLESEQPPAIPDDSVADSLSLLARWFYSKPRLGEIIFREIAPPGGWPYRRILRACARVLEPPKTSTPGELAAGSSNQTT
jgi:excinuclease ABC subunit C